MEVKSNIKNVTKETDDLGKSIGKASDETTGLGTGLARTGAAGSKGFKMISSAVYGLGLAIKALGLGLIISLFAALKESLERNQKVMNTVSTILGTISTTFNQVASTLIDVVKWTTKSTDRFNGLGKVMSGILTLVLTPFKLAFYEIKLAVQAAMLVWEKSPFGSGDTKKIAELTVGINETKGAIVETIEAMIEGGKDIITNFGDAVGEIGAIGEKVVEGISEISIKSNYELAKATTAAQNSSKLAEAAIQGLIEKYDRQAELQRQIRDDETKTFAERIAANQKLGEILDEQETKMLALADTRVASAALELSANKENVELQVAYQQALNDRAGVEAQVAGFRSEQMTNEVSLNKELGEIKKEITNATLEGMALELEELKNSYEMQLEMARKAGEDTTALDEKYAKDKKAILEAAAKNAKDLNKAEADAAKANVHAQLEAFSGLAGALQGLAGESKELAVGQAIIDTYVGANKAFAQGGTIGFVTAAAVIAAGLANVKTIMEQDVGGGGGGGSGASGGTSQTPAPQMMSGAFELGGGVAPEPVKAFVVTDEMSNSQNQLANIRRRATI